MNSDISSSSKCLHLSTLLQVPSPFGACIFIRDVQGIGIYSLLYGYFVVIQSKNKCAWEIVLEDIQM